MRWILLRLIPGRRVRQRHGVTFNLHVPQHAVSGPEGLPAAVAASLVDLPPNEVHQFDLLVEVEVWGGAGLTYLLIL